MSKSPNTDNRTGPVSLGDEDAVKKLLSETVFSLWDAVNNLTRLAPTRHERYRVTIFGSARAKPGSFAYEETKHAAAGLAKLGCDIITGGGPGLMRAANEGAAEVSGEAQSIGIRVDLPFEQEVNDFVGQVYQHRTFFTRLHQFVLASDAYIVAPGGIGTVLEMMMIWQLLQVHHLQEKPLILVGGMWPGLISWARTEMLSAEPSLANLEDFSIPHCVAGGREAIEVIEEHHARWRAGLLEPCTRGPQPDATVL